MQHGSIRIAWKAQDCCRPASSRSFRFLKLMPATLQRGNPACLPDTLLCWAPDERLSGRTSRGDPWSNPSVSAAIQELRVYCSRNRLGFKFVKELCITTDIAAIEQRDVELGIVAVQFATFIQCTHGRTDAKMQIPERLANLRNYLLLRVLAQLRSREKH